MSEHDVSRRDFLKRGALLGGALVWTTPVVQAVGMTPALAQVASPACNVWYAVKIQRVGTTTDWECVDISDQDEPSGNQCLDVDDVGFPVNAGGCGRIVSVIVAAEGATDKRWMVRLDQDCQFVEGSGRCEVKTGQDCFDTIQPGQPGAGGDVCEWDFETRTITFHSPNGSDISHVEFAFCCED